MRCEIGFAGFVDQLGNIAHGFVDGQVFQARVNDKSEGQAEQTKENAEEQQRVAVDAQEFDL